MLKFIILLMVVVPTSSHSPSRILSVKFASELANSDVDNLRIPLLIFTKQNRRSSFAWRSVLQNGSVHYIYFTEVKNVWNVSKEEILFTELLHRPPGAFRYLG